MSSRNGAIEWKRGIRPVSIAPRAATGRRVLKLAHESSESAPAAALFVQVAVPLPLPTALTYSVPASQSVDARVGSRARVPVGKRHVVGVIIGRSTDPPDLDRVLPVEEILDQEPVLPQSLLSLATFINEYYFAPIGEVVRAMLPQKLPAWGDQKLRLTRRGAFAGHLAADEQAIVNLLFEQGALRPNALGGLSEGNWRAPLRRLQAKGFVSSESARGTGSRYRSAVELPEGDLDRQIEACGRSAKSRAVVEFLAALGRPATVLEVTRAAECGVGVVRALIKKEILRSFKQLERLSLQRHRLPEKKPASFELTAEQESAVSAVSAALGEERYACFLLQGLTSSGKTEVYLRAVDRTLELGRTAILMVPEISLVPALAAEARLRFGSDLAILHSGLSVSERAQEWERVRAGLARVVLGPRSAVLAPLSNLGLVVVDEEQDSSFKQDMTPRYHARDVALVRAKAAGAVAILASATPSLETRLNVERCKIGLLLLTRRVGGGALPRGILVDMRREEKAGRRPGELRFSVALRTELELALNAGEQVILLRNRRGYSPILLCRACGERLECDACGLPRTLHKRDRRLLCHYCGSTEPVPTSCPSCGEQALDPIGAGTERVEETFRQVFPGVAVEVLDRDASRRMGGVAAILERFSSGSTQVLVGTQMVAKGHHFPRVGLTAVLSADAYLGFPDFRAVEKTYALLTQLGGRGGRGSIPGRLVIQTYYPEHYAIQAALDHDDERFAREEMRFRRIFHYPPYTRMIQVLLRGKDRQRTVERVDAFAHRLYRHPLASETRISGPAPAPLERLKGYWRFQILVRQPSASRLRTLITESLTEKVSSDLVVDVDPQDLL